MHASLPVFKLTGDQSPDLLSLSREASMDMLLRMEKEVRLRMMRSIDAILEVERRMELLIALVQLYQGLKRISPLPAIEVTDPSNRARRYE
jgi:hypothetical protein